MKTLSPTYNDNLGGQNLLTTTKELEEVTKESPCNQKTLPSPNKNAHSE